MRVLVVSEGKHEQAGALESLIKKLGGEGADLTFDKMSSSAIHVFNGKGPGFFKRAVGWLKEAQKRRFDALILLIDDDWKKDEKRGRQIADAQASPLLRLPRAMGIAIRTFDAWMLADEKALTEVLGYTVARQPDPEKIRDPKGVCEGLLENGQNQMAQSRMYAEVARRLNIDTLSLRCPMGFRPFAGYVRQVFGQEA